MKCESPAGKPYCDHLLKSLSYQRLFSCSQRHSFAIQVPDSRWQGRLGSSPVLGSVTGRPIKRMKTTCSYHKLCKSPARLLHPSGSALLSCIKQVKQLNLRITNCHAIIDRAKYPFRPQGPCLSLSRGHLNAQKLDNLVML